MALSDTDLERRLRELRVRGDDLPPAPPDLARIVRARHRRQRRTELLRLAAAGVAVALLFIGVPRLASSLDAQRAATAAPSEEAPRWAGQVLYEQPTRGSLAGDEEWVAGLADRALVPSDPAEVASTGQLPDSAIQERAVAFAGDVPGERVALVVARLWGGRVIQAWFTGPRGAEPDEMTMTLLRDAPSTGPLSLLDLPDAASPRHVLVVVGVPRRRGRDHDRPDRDGDRRDARAVGAGSHGGRRGDPVPRRAGHLAAGQRAGPDRTRRRVHGGVRSTPQRAGAAVEERSSVDLAALPDPRGVRGRRPRGGGVAGRPLPGRQVRFAPGGDGPHAPRRRAGRGRWRPARCSSAPRFPRAPRWASSRPIRTTCRTPSRPGSP